ncbi:MAG: type V CRISPR-associated protein Cas12b [Pirellulaceae bacterium]
MATAQDDPTTQRAYTLRLRGIDPHDQSWPDALWATHEAVNEGARVFGDWLLTLRGALDHQLADASVKLRNGTTRPPTDDERRDRRVLLALSWLSVEDARGAPDDESLIVASGTDSADCRARRLVDALTAILQTRGVVAFEVGDPNQRPEDQPGTWLCDCMSSLFAAIRDDAVWVNRSRAFDVASQQHPSLSRDDIWDFLEPFFASAKAYLKPARTESDEDDLASAAANEDKAKDLVQKAGGWLSKRMGAGGGANFEDLSKAYIAIAKWASSAEPGQSVKQAIGSLAGQLTQQGFSPSAGDAAGVLSVIGKTGHKSATRNHISAIDTHEVVSQDDLSKLTELANRDAYKCGSKIGEKGPRPYATMILQRVEAACGFTYLQSDGAARHREFSVMLDHAARRVNVAHSWIKNAEAERRQFESDAKRIENVAQDSLNWLRTYCDERGGTSGSLGEYRIRRRAIDGWDKVVARWARSDCQSTEDRIATARQLQDDPEIDKFGDIQLFEALAADEATCVWKPGGIANAQPLKDFVAAAEAEAKKKRFKVPAYRHPDPLRHPVFTDFGKSRWSIEYSAHRAPVQSDQLRQKVDKLTAAIVDARRKLDGATATQHGSRESKLTKAQSNLVDAQTALAAINDPHRVELKLWNGQTVAPVPMRWSSKRLIADLAIRGSVGQSSAQRVGVSRADRLGRAAGNAIDERPVSITGLFQQEYWNGRLQAPRAQLDAIANHVDKHGWDADAWRQIGRIRWLVSLSAKLAQHGPWFGFCNSFEECARARPFISRKGEYAVKHHDNDQRKGHAKLILSRLPGLRILAVDLGHRFAAACAVWEAIEKERMQDACKAAGVAPPDAHAMFVHLRGINSRGKPVTTIYRRIGAETLPDGTPHPAPWARLDRQFLIKLPGEDRPARAASPAEIKAVEDFGQWAGRCGSANDTARKRRIDLLMNDAVRTARLALARHGRRARIAFHLTAEARILPGGRQQTLDETGRINLLMDTLAEWHTLATDSRWGDELARQLWNERLAALNVGFTIDPSAAATQSEFDRTRAQRRQAEQELRQRLSPLVKALSSNAALRQQLHQAWTSRWNADDLQWRSKLKWLSRWLLPRGGSRRDGSRRHVGGLSLIRISTLTEFRRKVQVAYFTRLHPDGSRAEIGRQFGKSTLDAIQRLKDQRTKQLTSRIVEAALGIGVERDLVWDEAMKKRRCVKRPRAPLYRVDDQGVEQGDRRFQTCHAVVIEDLSHYRPEETRTRRENRATMDWKSAETRKRLADHCQLYGLHLRDVNPQYTSRQDSRTGAPGCRCVDVSAADFLTKTWWWKQVAQARGKVHSNKGNARDRLLMELDEYCEAIKSHTGAKHHLRIPVNGGDIFVSADADSPLAAGVQADLNAAANIGLRALMDPDFSGKWWYVPCDPFTSQPHAEKVKGSILASVGALKTVNDESAIPARRGRAPTQSVPPREVINLWRDPSTAVIRGAAGDESWHATPAYWNIVKDRVVQVLRERNANPSD